MYNFIDPSTREKSMIWDFITENEIATDDEIQLVTCISGYTVDTLNAIIFARTGYRDMKQIHDGEPENYYFGDLYEDEAEAV